MVKKDFQKVMVPSSDFRRSIYVLLYHPWLEGFKEYFTVHLSWLRKNEFKSIPLESLLHYIKGEQVILPEKPIVITFDDGTIENYTIAYPLLKKYGFTGTAFAPTAYEYINISGTDWWKEVDSKSILKIEGHSHTHALTFINAQIVNFYIKVRKDGEPIIKGQDERFGAPIFSLGYELVSTRFIPREELVNECVQYVNQNGGQVFFERENWRGDLFRIVSRYEGNRGQYESEEGKRERIKEELELSKKMIEETIRNGKKVNFFAYPFGAYDSDLIEYLRGAGYIGALTTNPGGNARGDNPYLIKRMMILNQDSFGGLEKILAEYL